MNWLLYLLVATAVAAVLVFLWAAGRAWWTYRGRRVITCPETRQPAAVDVDTRHAALTAFTGPDLRLADCSRWPEKRHCGQECLQQIEEAPADCLVRSLVTRWYAGKDCALCRKPIGTIHWHDHKPGLLTPEHHTLDWRDVPPEKLPAIFETHAPVCWNCYVAETFRERYPELVTERDPRWSSHLDEMKEYRRN